MKNITIINGPNLNLLGLRETSVYGAESFESYLERLKSKFQELELRFFQSNHEGQLIDYVQKAGFEMDAILINPGGLSHTSVSLADALNSVPCRKIEVHISNIHARESFRRETVTGSACEAVLGGFGLKGYEMALRFLTES
jgi:3-dehydroquinate dehydratase-2